MNAYWNNYVHAIKKYAIFEGRTGRKEFWMYMLVTVIFGFLAGFISPTLGMLYGLFSFIPNLAIGARRLHDAGRSGGWLFLLLLPVIGVIALIIMFLQPSRRS